MWCGNTSDFNQVVALAPGQIRYSPVNTSRSSFRIRYCRVTQTQVNNIHPRYCVPLSQNGYCMHYVFIPLWSHHSLKFAHGTKSQIQATADVMLQSFDLLLSPVETSDISVCGQKSPYAKNSICSQMELLLVWQWSRWSQKVHRPKTTHPRQDKMKEQCPFSWCTWL